jgi:hypothetical protein
VSQDGGHLVGNAGIELPGIDRGDVLVMMQFLGGGALAGR